MKSCRGIWQSTDVMKSLAKAFDRRVEYNEHGFIKKTTILDAILNKLIQAALVNGDQKALAQLLILAEKVYRADLEGRVDEPMRIVIHGGLPDT